MGMDWTKLEMLYGWVMSTQATGKHEKPCTIPITLARWVTRLSTPKPWTCLDVGCGELFYRKQFMDLGFSYQGVDLHFDYAAAGIYTDGCVIRQDYHWLDIKPVDFVFCSHTLEHSPVPILAMYRLMEFTKKGGLCMVVVPDSCLEDCPGHVSVLLPKGWLQLASFVGFDLVEMDSGLYGGGSLERRFLFTRKRK